MTSAVSMDTRQKSSVTMTTVAERMEKKDAEAVAVKRRASLSLRKKKGTEDSLLLAVSDKEIPPPEEENITPRAVKKKGSLSLRKRKRTEGSLLPIFFDKENQPLEEESLTPCVVSQDDPQEHTGHTRFGSPVNKEVMIKDKLGVVPNNTLQANQWALRNFNLWADTRSNKYDEDPVPSNLLACHDPTIVCKWLCCFVQETRKEDGQPYPPRSLKQLLCGLKRIMDSNRVPFNIFDRSNMDLRVFHMICDSVCSSLLKQGIGSTVSHSPTIPLEHEDKFWELGLLGMDTPRVLQDTVFFYVGLHFVLRGGEEQHSLKRSQFVRFPVDTELYDDETYYEYAENGSKNRQGRFDQVQSENKVVAAYAQPGNRKCIVKLLDLYLSKLPSGTDTFYLQPCQNVPDDPMKPWYVKQNVGINKIKEKLIAMSKSAELSVQYTNHSLRATAISRMYGGGIPEKVIIEKSGHKSIKALRTYERTTAEQDREACSVIADASNAKKIKVENSSDETEQRNAPVFSTLSHCTFNFHYK